MKTLAQVLDGVTAEGAFKVTATMNQKWLSIRTGNGLGRWTIEDTEYVQRACSNFPALVRALGDCVELLDTLKGSSDGPTATTVRNARKELAEALK